MLTRYEQRNLTWIDLVAPTPAEVRSLMREFTIDPRIAEELAVPSYTSKVERRGDHIYVILYFPQEIDFVLGKNFLLTARYSDHDPLHAFAKAFEVDSVLDRHGTMVHGGHLFTRMLRNLYTALGNESDSIRRKLQEIEERIFKGDERRMVIEISHIGRTIHNFRQVLLGHEELLKSLEPASARLYGPEFSFYMRGAQDEYTHVRTVLNHLRDSLLELRETNNSLLTAKQNEVIKVLTMMAFITFPLTLIAGIFSMHTQYTPIIGTPGDFWIVLGIMVAVAAGILIYFVRKGWL